MADTSEAILLGNDTQVVDLHKDNPPSHQYYNNDIQSIQDHLDSLINDLSSDWKGSIPFCCHVIYNNDLVHEQILEDTPPMIDICDYLGGLMYPAIKLLFSPITYPPPQSNFQMSSSNTTCTGWTALSRDLAVAAHEAGNSIMCNGSQKSQQDMYCNRSFRCGIFHRTTRTSAMELTDECQHRTTSLINDRRNNRHNGQLLAKCIKVVDQRGCSCRFQFTVKWDINLCDLRQWAGCSYNGSHPKLLDPTSIPLPTRLLTSDQMDEALHVVNSTSNNGCARNYLHGKFGKFVNIIKIAYLSGRENGNVGTTKDDIDLMMENLALSHEISFVSLSDVPVKDFLIHTLALH